MQLPFSVEQFYGVFREYNETLWPIQILLNVLGIIAIVLVIRPRPWSGAAISAILTFLWAWSALAYHLSFFTSINSLAYAFSALWFVGAIVFLWQGVIRGQLSFGRVGGLRAGAGAALIVFALVIYPFWSLGTGHSRSAIPTFGVPCPTTIFTIGLLAFLVRPYPRSVFAVPVIWSVIGGQAVFMLGVTQDSALIIAALAGLVWMFKSKPSV